MMKKIIFYSISIICIFFTIYNLVYMNLKNEKLENVFIEKESIEEVISEEEKISINTKGKMEIHYLSCGHTEISDLNFDDTLINLNEDKFKEKFIGWNVNEFSNENVAIEKDIEGFCYEHFVVKLAESKIVVYRKIDEKNEELFKETDIAEEFLTEEDKQKLEEGIEVYRMENLNSVIEDFE